MSLPISSAENPAASAPRCRPTNRPAYARGPTDSRRAVDRIVALPVGEAHRHVGLAEHHRARRGEALHGQRVLVGGAVALLLIAPGGRQAGEVEALLHRHRHAEQRPRATIPALRIERAGRSRARSKSRTTTALVLPSSRSIRAI